MSFILKGAEFSSPWLIFQSCLRVFHFSLLRTFQTMCWNKCFPGSSSLEVSVVPDFNLAQAWLAIGHLGNEAMDKIASVSLFFSLFFPSLSLPSFLLILSLSLSVTLPFKSIFSYKFCSKKEYKRKKKLVGNKPSQWLLTLPSSFPLTPVHKGFRWQKLSGKSSVQGMKGIWKSGI